MYACDGLVSYHVYKKEKKEKKRKVVTFLSIKGITFPYQNE